MSLVKSPGFLPDLSSTEMEGDARRLFRFKDFVLDIDERQLFHNQTVISLAPKNFDVLAFFVRRSGHLIEKDELMQSIWADAFVEEANLARVVHSLRRTLGEGVNGNKFIETVARKGYRFVADVEELDAAKTAEFHAVEPRIPPSAATGDVPEPAAASSKSRNSVNARYVFLIVCILVAATLVSLAVLYLKDPFAASPEQIDSVAVLPFENATQDAELEYLSDGITENVINTLSQIPNLRVSPRSSVFKYKNSTDNSEMIGHALSVGAVVTGKIVRRGDTFVIQTELIDVNRKAQIWGQQYVQSASNIFGSQNEIAKELVSNLRLELNPSQKQKLARSFTESPEAQKAFLNGLYLFNQSTQQSQNVQVAMSARKSYCEKSVEYFQEAINFDSNYSQAYANLARAYRCLAEGQFSEYHEKAREAALTAIRIDESNDMAHRVLAIILRQQDWNWTDAEREYKRAIELNPNESGDARQGLASLLSAQGRHDEAIQQIELVEQRFPETMTDNAWIGFIYKDARKYDIAIDKFRRIKEIRPDNTLARFGLSEVYALQGMNEEAVAEAREIVELMKGGPGARMFLSAILAKVGQRSEALEILAEYEGNYEKQPYPLSILIASTYAKLDNKDRAFFWLEKAYTERSADLIRGIKVSPAWDKLRDDPRYFDLLSRVGLN